MYPAFCPTSSGWQVFVRFAMAGAAPCVSRGLSGVGRRESARFSTTGGFSFVRERMADLHTFAGGNLLNSVRVSATHFENV